jgi:phosphoglycerate kinase
MKNEFNKYGKGKLMVTYESGDALFHQGEWLNENPFGVRSDWEKHVLDRGAPMYRLLLSKSASTSQNKSIG